MHRLMTIEAIEQLGWQPQGIAHRLRKHPADVKKLKQYKQAIEEAGQMGIGVLPIDLALISAAAAASEQYGLLTNDALVVAVMQAHGISSLASRDRDFDGIPGITRYSPL
jgi:predicted nucleic acid-binding protein